MGGPSNRQPVQLAQLAIGPDQGEESGDTSLDEDRGNQASPSAGQRPERHRWIEGAERHLAQPLVERRPLCRDRRADLLRKSVARAYIIDPSLVLEQHWNSGQLVQPGEQRRQPAPGQGQLAELAVEILRSLVQLGAPVHYIAQHLLFDLIERNPRWQGKQRQAVGVGNLARFRRHPT